MNHDQWPLNSNQELETKVESEKRPEKLFRAFTVSPEQLTLETLRSVLKPGTVSQDNPTKVHDGNELGVYMSTNQKMVESCYAVGGLGTTSMDVPKHMGSRGLEQQIVLPSCGIVLEIDTKNVKIRKPQITGYLKGVYNNGFEGDEWIADSVAPEDYKVVKLILSRWANDKNEISVPIADNSDEELNKVIGIIKEKYQTYKSEAEKLKHFLETLNERERLSYLLVRERWEKEKAKIESSSSR